MVETIKKILKLSDLNLYETIKISFFAFVLAILELLSIGILAIIISRLLFVEEQSINFSILEFNLNFSYTFIISLLLISFFIKFFMTYYLNKFIFKISNDKQHILRLRIFKLFSKLEFLKFLEKSPNLYVAVMGNYIKNYGSAFSILILFFGELLFFIILFLFLAYYNLTITTSLIVFFLIFFIFYIKIQFLNPNKVGFDTKEAYKSLYDFIINFFSSFKEIKIYNKFETINSNLKSHSDKLFISDLKNNLLSIIPRLSIEFVIVVFISLLLFFSLKFNFGINENKEYFSILFASVIKLLPFFVQLLRLQNTLRYTEPFVNEINENIDLLEKFQTKDISNTTLNYNFKKISIKSIVFSYEKNLIINNAELNIELNKFVSISGPSGSGKTTLLNILCGFIEPQNQKIFFDEKEVDSKTKLSNLIAYVPQDKFVFEGEVWKNISLEYEKKL